MFKMESAKGWLRRWLVSIPFFALYGLILGALISIPLIPKATVATVTISGAIVDQAHVDDILDMLRFARDEEKIKAVVLRIDSPGAGASITEEIYLDVLRLRQQKPVVASVGTKALSGAYYIAVASNFIYAEPASQLGSVGAWMILPRPEKVDENITTSGLFKATGGSRRKAFATLETFRQHFVDAVISQRGEHLKLSAEDLSQAEIYMGAESLRYGLIDDIGTSTAAIEKAASLARIKNYGVKELDIEKPAFGFFNASDLEALKSRTGLVPAYYYLYFESE